MLGVGAGVEAGVFDLGVEDEEWLPVDEEDAEEWLPVDDEAEE